MAFGLGDLSRDGEGWGMGDCILHASPDPLSKGSGPDFFTLSRPLRMPQRRRGPSGENSVSEPGSGPGSIDRGNIGSRVASRARPAAATRTSGGETTHAITQRHESCQAGQAADTVGNGIEELAIAADWDLR